MGNGKATLIFTFFFGIPYLCAQLMIGIAYNALVLHADSIWRTAVGAIVGATIIYFAKIPLERPLRILGKYTTIQFIHLAVRFFMLQEAKLWKIILNYLLDLTVAFAAIDLVRVLFPTPEAHAFIIGTPFGWVLALMVVSLCIGAYMDLDAMSLVPTMKKMRNL
ncbi:hypothetical protein [Lacticaseibacillus mingshuiensis]|uniref:Uncharacterized protein n=1 Tax=Lacticaseibacillus mingshuiensis TaxID=2799574 RepID=A0ABW4CHI7_9LACO|nr:hypothetical protein [Lacticaseibacillus mingshuiensis]